MHRKNTTNLFCPACGEHVISWRSRTTAAVILHRLAVAVGIATWCLAVAVMVAP